MACCRPHRKVNQLIGFPDVYVLACIGEVVVAVRVGVGGGGVEGLERRLIATFSEHGACAIL